MQPIDSFCCDTNPGVVRCQEMATLLAGYIPQRKVPLAKYLYPVANTVRPFVDAGAMIMHFFVTAQMSTMSCQSISDLFDSSLTWASSVCLLENIQQSAVSCFCPLVLDHRNLANNHGEKDYT